MKAGPGLAALVTVLLIAPRAEAGHFDMPEDSDREVPYRLTGLLDLRFADTSAARSWLLGGTNKLRYGGKSADGAGGTRAGAVFAVPQASVVLDAVVPHGPAVHLQANADSDLDSGGASVGLVEAYATMDGRAGKNALRLKAGAFIPPVSWEHPETAWSTHYTLTPSAIGSWVSEELRLYGAEASWSRKWGGTSTGLTGAVFGGADEAGWLLLARGWGLHDYQTKLNDRLNLPFPGVTEQPSRELDGRAGWYGRADLGLADGLLKISGGYWDNNADPNTHFTDASGTWSVWSTQFWDAGAKLDWRRLTLLGQYIAGQTAAAGVSRRKWDSWYGLAAFHLEKWTLSARYDQFYVDGGWEDGHAWTGDVQYELGAKARLSAEYIDVDAAPGAAVRPNGEKDHIAQLNYRLKFGG